MRPQTDPRSLRLPHLALAATALGLVGLLGQTGVAAERPEMGRTILAQPDCTVCIVGTPDVQWSGTSGSLHVDRVENRTGRTTLTLALDVELQSTYPNPQDFFVGEYRVSDLVRLGPLPPGGSHSNIDSGRIAFDGSGVPAGDYWMIVLVLENIDTSWPYFLDYVVLDDKVTCDGSSCTVPRPCSTVRAAGVWGYTKTGTLFAPTGATPFATMGILTLEKNGTLSGVNTGSVGGRVSQDVLTGTFEVKPDCTGTTTVEVYDPAGALLRTIGMALVVDEDASHLRGLVTSLTLPNGVVLPTVITADARRVTRNGGAGERARK